ncbi:DUF4129 domain-containing protein [Streptomyces sp. NPDC006984]|uniref:DUF4129 domain-containing protein n=1 Tax=Streptomyces sp. NPDC006984 TaxID=3155463 RepID=UPI0033D93732
MSGTGGVAAAIPLTGARDGTPVDVPRVPAREAAERELSDPAYREHEPNLLERALDAFLNWVGELFDGLSGSGPGGVVGLAVFAVVLGFFLTALWWRMGSPRRTATPSDTLFDDGPRSAAQYRASAEEHAAAERWNQALQDRMRALVRSLEERAILTARPGRTADEAATEAGGALPEHAGELRSAARAFDDVTYGGRSADRGMYERLRSLDTAVERTRPRWETDQEASV